MGDVMLKEAGVCPWNTTSGTGCAGGRDPVLPDVLIIPPGRFATNGVLRNDAGMLGIIRSMSQKGKGIIAAIGSGVEVVSASLTDRKCSFAVSSDQHDLVTDVTLQGNQPW